MHFLVLLVSPPHKVSLNISVIKSMKSMHIFFGNKTPLFNFSLVYWEMVYWESLFPF